MHTYAVKPFGVMQCFLHEHFMPQSVAVARCCFGSRQDAGQSAEREASLHGMGCSTAP